MHATTKSTISAQRLQQSVDSTTKDGRNDHATRKKTSSLGAAVLLAVRVGAIASAVVDSPSDLAVFAEGLELGDTLVKAGAGAVGRLGLLGALEALLVLAICLGLHVSLWAASILTQNSLPWSVQYLSSGLAAAQSLEVLQTGVQMELQDSGRPLESTPVVWEAGALEAADGALEVAEAEEAEDEAVEEADEAGAEEDS